MAGVWKPHVEWIDEAGLEADDFSVNDGNGTQGLPLNQTSRMSSVAKTGMERTKYEKVVIGWSGTIWIINVYPGGPGVGKDIGDRKIGRVDVVTM